MTRSKVKVKVTRPLKLEILQFSKSISSAIFNVSWQMTTDSETMEQYLTFVRSRFLISVLVFVSRDFELGRVSVQFANAFAIAITFARWRRHSEEVTAVPYGANLYIIYLWQTFKSFRWDRLINVRTPVCYHTWHKTSLYRIRFRSTRTPNFVPKTLKNCRLWGSCYPISGQNIKQFTPVRKHEFTLVNMCERNILIGVFSFAVQLLPFPPKFK